MLKATLSGIALVCALAAPAFAQSGYPNKPVRIVVPVAAGGGVDTLARIYALHMSKVMGQQFYVENKPGAGNIIGIEAVARAPADGYTLLIGAPTITLNHFVYKKLPYDVAKDFTPVTQLVSLPNVLVVHPSLGVNTLKEFIAAAKSKPGEITYASAGVGSSLHLAMELIMHTAQIKLIHVPYRGLGPGLQDVVAGHVKSMVANILSSRVNIESGKLKALGVTSLARAPALPDVPTISEAGLKDFEVLNWFGMFAPAGTPQPIIDRLQTEAAKIMHSPETKKRLSGDGADPIASTPADFAKFVKSEMIKWAAVAKNANIKLRE